MHELSLALSLLDEVDAVVKREGATRAAKVRLRLGRMSGIVHDALLFSWDVARSGTVAAEAELQIETIAVTVWCSRCDAERSAREGGGLECETCGAIAPSIVHGREMELVAMEIV
jgi:hydrogenase nickel incorporation protein HypA/HybF